MLLSLRSDNTTGRYNLERLSAFCDGVIVIALTLLVLGLEVPSVHNVPESKLPEFLRASAFPIVGYLLSFFLIGMYWIQHYEMFHVLSHADRPFVTLNLIFLLCVSFLPFPTGLHAAYRKEELGVIVYAVAQIACGLSLLGVWFYAAHGNRLVLPDFPRRLVWHVAFRIAISPALCVVAIAVSFIHPWISRFVFAAIPLLFWWQGALDMTWKEKQGK